MANVGFGTFSVIPSFDGFGRQLERGTSGALTAAGTRGGARFGDAAGKSAGSRFGRIFSTAAKASLIGAAGVGALAVKLGGDAVSAASDQTESVNAVNVAYGKQGRAVQKLGKQAAKSLALPRTEFNELAVRFSNFASTIGGGKGKQTVKALDNLTKRGADFASVYNIDVAEAATLFQSGLAGETEPLRRFGIDMSAATVQAFAYSQGIADQGSKLTEAQKVQARYQILMQQTAKTQGDLANTSGSLANQQRFLNARWDDAKAKLGRALLPVVQDFTGFLLDKGIPAVEDFSDWFNKKGIPAIKDTGKKLRPLADELLPAAANAFSDIKDFAGDALPKVEGIVDSFNKMPGWMKKVLVGGAAGGVVLHKFGLDSTAKGLLTGSNGLLSKGGSPARPLYVWTVNGGLGDGVGGTPKGAGIKGLGKFSPLIPFIPVGIGSAPGQESLLHKLFGIGPDATEGVDSLGRFPLTDDQIQAIGEMNKKLSRTQSLWVDARLASEDYAFQVKNGIPRSALTTVTNWPLKNKQARDYLATLLQIRDLHMDTRLDRAGGSGTTPGSGINPTAAPTPGRPHDRGGVNLNFNGEIRFNDQKEFMGWAQRKSIGAFSTGGW